jgi:hypothetical protein
MGTTIRPKRSHGTKTRSFERNGGVLGMKHYAPHG